ncbi:Hypothetical predicted protein [Mytilus galloprovincialis]|uniref:Uncharacterized protein n=1 Tax=Mytilus galloprovincialis TaxID=29158 RepID=A0A8B6CME3_MYTGA|nr:Hypothetical predicted protein [Mytilus galloprovincialis]
MRKSTYSLYKNVLARLILIDRSNGVEVPCQIGSAEPKLRMGRGNVIHNTISLIPSMAENQRGEVKESRLSKSLKVDVQNTDGVKMSRGQLNPNPLLRHMAENQSGEVKESTASQSVKIDVQDTDDVRKHMAENKSGEVKESRASQSVKIDVQDTDDVRKHMAENKSGEVKESRASQSVKIDVQDTDDVRKVISHIISLMPSIWRILHNFLVKRTAEPNSSASSHGRNQSGEVKESTVSQSVKIDVQDSDDVRKVISHIISLMPSIWSILDNFLVKRTAEPKSSAS